MIARDELKIKSIEIILEGQDQSGAYTASPHFSPYKFSWIRDGSFIAYAMSVVGEIKSAEKFHNWVNENVLRREDRINDMLLKINRENYPPGWALPARLNFDGTDDTSGWPTHQIDGYGIWLWSVIEHAKCINDLSILSGYEKSIELVGHALQCIWHKQCIDCWEEWGECVHTSTLACIYGGLKSAGRQGLLEADKTANEIKQYVLETLVYGGRLNKNTVYEGVDSSLLWVSTPFSLLDVDDEIMQNTVKSIYGDLVRNHGVKRYRKDTYYGAGSWIILTACLGWYESQLGNKNTAEKFLRWIEQKADDEGRLPEQVPEYLFAPEHYEPWAKRWGPIANPLLWSHAMYLILQQELSL